MKRMSKKELVKRLESHNLWLEGNGGERLVLENVDLFGIEGDLKFKHVDLKNVDFRASNIDVCFIDCRLENVDFSGANLKEPGIYNSVLNNVKFDRVTFEYGGFIEENVMENVTFSNCKVENILFDKNKIYSSSLKNVDFIDSMVMNCVIRDIEIKNSKFHIDWDYEDHVNLISDSQIISPKIRNSKMWGFRLRNTEVIGYDEKTKFVTGIVEIKDVKVNGKLMEDKEWE